MKKKTIATICILSVFVLVAAGLTASGVMTDKKSKLSPLFKVRSKRAIKKDIPVEVKNKLENIKDRLSERLFLPLFSGSKNSKALSILICTISGDAENCISLNSQCIWCKGPDSQNTAESKTDTLECWCPNPTPTLK